MGEGSAGNREAPEPVIAETFFFFRQSFHMFTKNCRNREQSLLHWNVKFIVQMH